MTYEYTKRLELIEDAIHRALPAKPDDNWLRSVFPHVPAGQITGATLDAAILPARDLLARGGKRWRPLLMTLVCEALGGGDAAIPLAPLVEFCHNASLIHDDIEDGSEERRGAPAIHRLYGEDTAINAGSLLYFLPLDCIEQWAARLEPGGAAGGAASRVYKGLVYKLWGQHMRKLHLGQAMDISWHKNHSFVPGIEEYELMCRLKTGSLASLAAGLGVYAAFAVAGGETDEAAQDAARYAARERFEEAAEKLGQGFQILDDVKNLTTGNPGKKRGDDVVEGKKSLPVILYLHQNPGKIDFVARCFSAAKAGGVNAPQVEEFIGEISASGVLEAARERGLGLIASAREIFEFAEKKEGPRLLAGLTEFIS
ncbi:MAG: polyprenyl synthetase family protein [Spirochaetes bacterium]|nr:polyprenyl synthetase family protein [Spirochaetota bacterium]